MRALRPHRATAPIVGHYTTLLLQILYGPRHTNGRSRRGRILSNSRAIAIVWRMATVLPMQVGERNDRVKGLTLDRVEAARC